MELGEYEQTFDVEMIDNIYTRRADFILRIQGRSMEPRYCDGDRILIKEQSDVDFGDVGVWIIDNLGYVKKKGEDRLISLNPDEADVYPAETAECRCVGYVVGVLDPDWVIN